MAEETSQQQSGRPEKKPNIFQKAGRWIKRAGGYTRKFVPGLIGDNKFWSRLGGAVNGGFWIGEAVLGALFLPALPLALHAAVLAGFGLWAAVGLCAIGYGFTGAWKRIEELCVRIFPKLNPLKKLRLRARKTVAKIAGLPLVRQGLGGLRKIGGKIARLPPVRKFLESRPGRLVRGGLTQNQQDVFLALVTLQGAPAGAAGFSILLAHTVARLAAAVTPGGVLAATGYAYLIASGGLDVVSSLRTLSQVNRARKNAKKAAATAPAVAPPTPEAAASPLPAQAAPAFNGVAANDDVSAAASPAAGTSTAAPVSKPLQPKQA